MVRQVEGLGNDVKMTRAERDYLENTQVEINVGRRREGVSGVADGTSREGIDVLAIAVESGDCILSESACDAQDRCELKPGEGPQCGGLRVPIVAILATGYSPIK